jgi:Zn finger protein HypA/HybF involved in hydrogenase expression
MGISTIFPVNNLDTDDMKNQIPHPAIAHLSKTEMETLKSDYLARGKAAELIERFKIKCTPHQLYKVLPPRILDQTCPVCGSVMLQDLPSRYHPKSPGLIHCSSCQHQDNNQCHCPFCRERFYRWMKEDMARREAKIAQAIIAERQKYSCSSYSIEDLPLSTAVAFLAFSKCCPIDQNGFHGSLDESVVPFAPNGSYGESLLAMLRKAGLIRISEHSRPSSISHEDEQLIFDPQRVYWTGNMEENLRLVEEIESRALTEDWPEHWWGQLGTMWSEIALAECMEYYDYCAKKRRIRIPGDEATTAMLRNILRDYSVAQCYNIIWYGASSTSDLLRREKKSEAYAAKYMVFACQRRANRCGEKDLKVIAFERRPDLPRSMISYVLFDLILKIGDRGFSEAISSG